MTTGELAARMGVAQQRLSTIERDELAGSIQLSTLERAADALGCDVVYGLVPRTSLDAAVRNQARRKALAQLQGVSHHMRLEDQASAVSDEEVDDLAGLLIDKRGLWTEPDG